MMDTSRRTEVPTMKLIAPYALCGLLLLCAVPVLAQSESEQPDARPGNFIGTVLDGMTRKPARDVAVIATSPSLETERTVFTDEQGHFRMPLLPPGTYTLKFDHPRHSIYQRRDILLRPTRTVRVTVELAPGPYILE
jgi:hypothetical protein